MLNNKIVNEITFKDIIEQKIKFTIKNDIFDEEEYRNTNKGELLAYNQMLGDIEILQVQTFVNKYIHILNDVNQKLDNNLVKDSKEIEKLSGINNAIVSVLKLINPVYEYKMD